MSFNLDHIDKFHESGIWIPGRIIYLESNSDDELDHTTASKFIKNWTILTHFNKDPITCYMNCPGGVVKDGYAIYDCVKTSDVVATCTVFGECSSMGTIVLQAFDKRLAHINSSFMLHDGSNAVAGTYRDVERRVESDRQERLRSYKLYADATGKPAAYFARKLQNDWFLNPEEALTEGLIDEVIQ